jgi:hypothetical protein
MPVGRRVGGQQVDDTTTATGGDHRLGCQLGEEIRALEVDVDRLVPHLLAHFEEHTWGEDGGVVDQNVDPSEPVHGLRC